MREEGVEEEEEEEAGDGEVHAGWVGGWLWGGGGEVAVVEKWVGRF